MSFRKKDFRDSCAGIAFLLPNILGFLAFTLIPLLISLFMAFTNWNLEMHNMFQDQPLRSVGFDNFIKLFTDPDFFSYLGNTLFLMLGIPFGMAGSLVAALLLNNDFRGSRRTKQVFWIVLLTILLTVSCCMLVLTGLGAAAMTLLVCAVAGAILIGGAFGGQSVYRTLFYFPSFTAGVATYILWKKLYSPENGPINNVIQPILDTVNPTVAAITQTGAERISSLLLLLMGAGFAWMVWRRILRWKNGECGTVSLVIGLVLLSIPLILCQIWSPRPWGGALGWTLVSLAFGALIAELNSGPKFKALPDYGLADVVIFDGMLMIGLFILLGLANVVLGMPECANVAGGMTAPKWLSDYYWAKPAIMIMGFWGAIGSNNMLLYLAGLSGISPELYEAADIDGASPFQKFWNVTWPQLANVTFFILVMSIMGGLQGGFEMARTMTQGGPAGSTTTLAYYIYTEGFATGNLGYASAVAWTLFALVLSVTLFNWKFGNRYTND
ncbi:MAG: sugar ABC transporter permease [Victivallaceae bacterium]|nr:sugar ABC transporter permease [Victivallaceae bacterium]